MCSVLIENTAAHSRIVETLLTKGPYLSTQRQSPESPLPGTPTDAPPVIRRELKPTKEPGEMQVGVVCVCEGGEGEKGGAEEGRDEF